jgi:hypothetical protein
MLLPRPEIRMTIFFIRGFYHSGGAKPAGRAAICPERL